MSRLKALVRKLAESKSIALVIHQNPDGDAVGSAVALLEALKAAGRQTTLTCVNEIPLPFQRIVGSPEVRLNLPADADTYLLLDCSDLGRSGFRRQLQQLAREGKTVLAIDHHENSEDEKEISASIVNPKACATAEIVYQLLAELRLPISPKIANAIMLGIYTDTGAFTHPNTTGRTLELAGELLQRGASLQRISQAFYRSLPVKRQKLWGRVLSELRISKFGFVVARITAEHFRQTQTTVEDILGLANMLSLIDEALVALVLIETGPGTRGVLRTRHQNVDVGRLARLLGGTGQKKAAGFTTTFSVI